MPKNFYDQYDTKCTKCRQEVYSGGGNQFVDGNGILQRYCQKCHRKWWQELERKYDAAAAKSAESALSSEPGEVGTPEPPITEPATEPVVSGTPEVDKRLPEAPTNVEPTPGAGTPPGPVLGEGNVLGS